VDGAARSPRRNELLHALREAQDGAVNDTAAWAATAVAVPKVVAQGSARQVLSVLLAREEPERAANPGWMLPEMVGTSEPMQELARLIRLVAPRSTTVLIEGETGTGKEVVARAVHRLSARAGKPFAVLNCAAIPEALLEAELFGHTRGAFTGAVQSRTGRIEAAHGGTLFLDEIGEMPLALQAKMLRFLECGELQRVGDNETMRVDVRVIAATHQPLEQRAEAGTFRLDLYHRLAVFPVEVPALRTRMEDLTLLAEHFLEQMGQEMPRKRLTVEAAARLMEHSWPGNVRELMHVLERGAILSGDRMEIGAEEIRFRRASRG
jgi:transcriptional regulator with GAF, ATPase, and Fis domain